MASCVTSLIRLEASESSWNRGFKGIIAFSSSSVNKLLSSLRVVRFTCSVNIPGERVWRPMFVMEINCRFGTLANTIVSNFRFALSFILKNFKDCDSRSGSRLIILSSMKSVSSFMKDGRVSNGKSLIELPDNTRCLSLSWDFRKTFSLIVWILVPVMFTYSKVMSAKTPESRFLMSLLSALF